MGKVSDYLSLLPYAAQQGMSIEEVEQERKEKEERCKSNADS